MDILEAVQEELTIQIQTSLLQQAISAIRKADRDTVIQCLEQGLLIDSPDTNGETLLHHAAGNPDIVKLLLERGASAKRVNRAGESPAFFAVRHNSKQSLDLLFDMAKIDVNGTTFSGKTLLHYAKELQHPAMVDLLLKRGADPHRRNFSELTTLMEAAERGEIKPIEKYILEGQDVNAPNKQADTLLHHAAGSPDLVQLLLLHGADPKLEAHSGRTPASCAMFFRNRESLKYLMQDGGFDINHVHTDGETLFHQAVHGLGLGFVSHIEFLFECRADPLIKNRDNELPLDITDNCYQPYKQNPMSLALSKPMQQAIYELAVKASEENKSEAEDQGGHGCDQKEYKELKEGKEHERESKKADEEREQAERAIDKKRKGEDDRKRTGDHAQQDERESNAVKAHHFSKLQALGSKILNREYFNDVDFQSNAQRAKAADEIPSIEYCSVRKGRPAHRATDCFPIIYALKKGNMPVVRTLMKAGAYPRPAALYAIEHGLKEIALELIRNIKYVNKEIQYYNKRGHGEKVTLLQMVFSQRNNIDLDILELLLDKGAKLDSISDNPPAHPMQYCDYLITALHHKGPLAVKIVEVLLHAGAKVGGIPCEYLQGQRVRKNVHFSETPLLIASRREGFHPLYPLLMNRDGITVDTRCFKSGRSALLEACDREDISAVDALLRLGADPNFINDDWNFKHPPQPSRIYDPFSIENPLRIIVRKYKATILVPLLVAYGATLDFQDEKGNTILHRAFADGDQALILILEKLTMKHELRNPIDLYHTKNDDGMTPAELQGQNRDRKLNFLPLYPLLKDCFDPQLLDGYAQTFAQNFHMYHHKHAKTLDITTVDSNAFENEWIFLLKEMKQFWGERKAMFYQHHSKSLNAVEQALNKKGCFGICSCEAPITQQDIQKYLDQILEHCILGIVFYFEFKARPKPRLATEVHAERSPVMIFSSSAAESKDAGEQKQRREEEVMSYQKLSLDLGVDLAFHADLPESVEKSEGIESASSQTPKLLIYYDAANLRRSVNWHVDENHHGAERPRSSYDTLSLS